jgi:hypothetical protein
MSGQTMPDDIERRLPAGDEIFLDHVGHFVRDGEAASRALARCGFAPTPISIQVNSDATGAPRPTGTGNVTAMLSRGYLEVLFKTSDTPLSRELDAALERHAGVHLAALAVADAAKARRRLATDGFAVRELVQMQRPVATPAGTATAAFTIARVESHAMPEGRIQILTHRTEQSVWQERWLSQPNSAVGLIDLMIAVADLEAAAERFGRFAGRAAAPTPGGAHIRLDRGGIYLLSHERAMEKLPEIAFSAPPFMVGYALQVESLAAAEQAVDNAGLEWHAFEDGIAAAFPADLGEGAWLFVERASALPWRR